MIPESEKPRPDIVAELMVTEFVPVEVRVTVWVTAVLTDTLPKFRLVVPTLRLGTAAFNCTAKVSGVPPMLADSVAVCVEVTDETLAVKLALLDPAATVTEEGTVTELLVLDRLTAYPPEAAAALRVTVQVSVPEPVKDEVEQVNPVSSGTPVPLSGIVVAAPPLASLASES